MGVRTVGKYLKRWGLTPQKPIKKAYEQRPEAVQAWLDERYLIIDEAFNADKLIEFSEALIKDAGKEVFLILDNLRVHHSKSRSAPTLRTA